MDRLDAALKKIKKKKMNEAAPLAVIGKAALVAGKALAKGAAVAGKAGAKGAKVAAKGAAKGAKGVKTVTPKVMGGEVKKSAQLAKNVKPKSGPTVDVKARRVGGDLVKTNKPTGSSTQPKVSNSGKKTVDPKKNDVTQKIKDQVKDQASNQNKPQDQNKPEDKKDDNVDKGDKKTDTKKKSLDVKKKVADTVGGISGAFGKSSFAVTESKKTFAQFVDEAVPDEYEEEQLDELAATAVATSPIWAPAVKAGAVAAGAYALSKAPQIYSSIKNMMSKKKDDNKDDQLGGKYDPSKKIDRTRGDYDYKAKNPTDNIDSELSDRFPGVNYRKLLDPSYKANRNPRLSRAIKYVKDKLNRKKFNDKLTSSSPQAEFKPDKSVKPGRNEKAIEKIRADLTKINDKNK